MAWQGYDPNMRAIEGAEEARLKKRSDEYNPNILATRRWMPVVPWRRPAASDEQVSTVPFEGRIVLSPLVVLGIIIACAVIGLFLLLR